METRTRYRLGNKDRLSNYIEGVSTDSFSNPAVVSFSSTLFHEDIKKARNEAIPISHHPRVCEGGAKPPRCSLIMRNLLILAILLLSIMPVNAAPLWLESRMDTITLWFTPPSQKALLASNTALERIRELSDDEEKAIQQIYSLQELLTIIEQNINIQGNPHKALRKQQEIERRLLVLQEEISKLEQNSEQYKLVVLHASLRVNLLLKETELAKEKTKVKLES